jgi:hypothetical protein
VLSGHGNSYTTQTYEIILYVNAPSPPGSDNNVRYFSSKTELSIVPANGPKDGVALHMIEEAETTR